MNRYPKLLVASFALFAFSSIGYTQTPPRDAGTTQPPVATATSRQPSVDLYVIPGCSYCEKARGLLRARGVSWQEHDVANSTEARRIFTAKGGKGTPLLVIGNDVIHGVDAARLDDALQANGITSK